MCFNFDLTAILGFSQSSNYGLQAIHFPGLNFTVRFRYDIFRENERLVNLDGLENFPSKANSESLIGVPDISWDSIFRCKFFGKLLWCKTYTMCFA